MVTEDESVCPDCGCGEMIHYDSVKRIVRTKGRKANYVRLRRLQCKECKRVHREIPSYIFPYKQYESEIINGVLEGNITSDTLGYEDYPCELTMITWVTRISHTPL